MAIQFKRIHFITLVVLAAFSVILSALLVRDNPLNSLIDFSIPALPPTPNSAVLLISHQQGMRDLLRFGLTPAQAWVVELPDMKQRSDADALVNRLRQQGFKAFSRQFSSLTGTWTRVFVGPEIKPEQMKLVADRLAKLHFITKVVPFDPLLVQ